MNRPLATFIAVVLFMTGTSSFAKVVKKRDPVKESFIVVLKDTVAENFVETLANDLSHAYKGKVQAVYTDGLKGFSVRMKDADAELLSQHPHVEWVEEDANMYLSTTQVVGLESWGLDRIDQFSPTGSSSYSYVRNGTGVRAYVMDTGIYAAHDEFLHGTGPTGTGTTRVEAGIDYVNDGTSATNPCAPAGQWYTGTNPHGAGHGTSVASILGGRLYGVAKEVILTPVRVFGCGGGADTTRFLNGLNWIRTHYAADNKPALINVSGYVLRIDPGISNADRDAIEVSVGQTIAAGITVISSANNRNEDACWTSPAHIPGVITVGGSMRNTVSGTLTDTSWISPDPVWSDANRDPGTNWGGCVDIFAPAHDLRSADVTSSTAYRTTDTSGTSFASPHVAGAVARYLQGRFKAPNNPGLAWSFIDGNSWKGIMADNFDNPLNGSPNKLLSVLPTY